MTTYSNFFGGAFFGGGFFGPGVDTVVGGHGSEGGEEGAYEEPRRVIIQGKPYTVRSKQEYLGLIARGKRDKAREDADAAIARSQVAARTALQERVEDTTAETAALLHALLAKEAKKKLPIVETDEIPVQILMMMAADL